MFIDTNVFVYARLTEAPQYQLARAMLQRASISGERMCISRQIMREYLATLTRPQTLSMPVSRDAVLNDVAKMSRQFEILEEGTQVTTNLLILCNEVNVSGSQIHDANIVATMLAHGEHRLLTFNVADFRRYENRIEILTG